MPKVKIVRAFVFAATVTFAFGVGSAARAAPVMSSIGQSFAPRSTTTPVYWVYRHHQRYWVPDRRRGSYREDYRR